MVIGLPKRGQQRRFKRIDIRKVRYFATGQTSVGCGKPDRHANALIDPRTMQDPFKPNDHSQLMREAQMGFVVIGLLLCVLVYVAVFRMSGRGRRYRDVARAAPVATVSQGEAYPARTAMKVEEKIDRSPTAAAQSLNRIEENLAAVGRTLESFQEPSVSVDADLKSELPTSQPTAALSSGSRKDAPSGFESVKTVAMDSPEKVRSRPIEKLASPIESEASGGGSEGVALATFEASLARGTESAFEKTLPEKDSLPFFAKPIATTKSSVATKSQERGSTTVPAEFQPKASRPEAANSFRKQSPQSGSDRQFNASEKKKTTSVSTPREPAPSPRIRSALREPEVVEGLDKSEQKSAASLKSANADIPFSPLRAFRKPGASASQSKFSSIDFAKANSFEPDPVTDQSATSISPTANSASTNSASTNSASAKIASANSASAIPSLPAAPAADKPSAVEGQPRNSLMSKAGDEMARIDTYTVVKGDSMWSIAQATYGDGQYFRALFEHNVDRLSGSDRLEPGVVLSTPPLDELRKYHESFCPAGDCKSDPNIEAEYDAAISQRFYVTHADETVFGIARDRLGQASRYLEIIELNEFRLPAKVTHLTPLKAGIRLLLPE